MVTKHNHLVAYMKNKISLRYIPTKFFNLQFIPAPFRQKNSKSEFNFISRGTFFDNKTTADIAPN